MKNLTYWKIAGTVAIITLGFILHYLFAWTNESKIIGLFVPVNESVWEHLKLGYWSLILFSIPEYPRVKRMANNYVAAKTIGVLSLELTIIAVYYGYTFFTGHHLFLIDIASYIVGAATCQYVSHIFFRFEPYPRMINRLSLGLFISLGVMFGVLTFHPPHVEIFKDPNDKTYGIAKEK